MARPCKPWYRKSTGWWMVEHMGRQHKLARGEGAIAFAQRALAVLQAGGSAVGSAGVVSNQTPEPTVSEVFAAHLRWSQRHNTSRCHAEKKRTLDDFARLHGARRACEVKPHHVHEWIDAHPDWVSGWTRGNAAKWIKGAFGWAVREGLIDRNPLTGVRAEQGEPRRALTPREYGLLKRASRHGKKTGDVASSGRRFREQLAFLRLTGARPGEARQLQWSQIDWERGTATLRHHKTSKKTKSPRVLYLTKPVVKILRLIGARDGTEGHVFKTYQGLPWERKGFSQQFRRLKIRIGLPNDAVPYGLRHLFGTNGVRAGIDHHTLAALMGHKGTRMLSHYVHIADDHSHLASAAARIARPKRSR